MKRLFKQLAKLTIQATQAKVSSFLIKVTYVLKYTPASACIFILASYIA